MPYGRSSCRRRLARARARNRQRVDRRASLDLAERHSRAGAVAPGGDLFADHEQGITVVDTGFVRPRFDASLLLVEGGRAAFVDVGTNFSVPRLLESLQRKGVSREAVDWVILTHVHLDHAGGAGELLRNLPSARLVVHPRGARHLVDPTKLVAGASAVYGAEAVRRTYGELVPVDPARVLEAPEGLVVELSGRPLRILDTPGHARHHLCVWDEAARVAFTGDTFGLAYPELTSARGAFVVPTTTPVQFQPEALHRSLDRIVALGPRAVFLTHYGRVADVEARAADLHAQVDALVALARQAEGRDDRGPWLRAAVAELFAERASAHGCPVPPETARELLAVDVELDAQGLEVWLSQAPRQQ